MFKDIKTVETNLRFLYPYKRVTLRNIKSFLAIFYKIASKVRLQPCFMEAMPCITVLDVAVLSKHGLFCGGLMDRVL